MRIYLRKIWGGAEYVVIMVVAGAVLFPLFWIVLTGFKSGLDVYSIKLFFHPTLINFSKALFKPHYFIKHIFNSFFCSGVATFIGVALATPAAYGFSRFSIWGKKGILFWIISVQFIPSIAIVIPIYALFRNINLLDTRLSLIVLYLTIIIPFSIWIIKSFIDGIPQQIEESAIIDGAGVMHVLWYIIVPLARPAIVVATILGLIQTLNVFLYALVLTSKDAVTMTIAIASLETNEGVLWEIMAAFGTIMFIPVFVFAFVVQKYLVRGLTLGAIK